jgi:hypothetical protein
MRIEYCPALSPLKVSRRLLGRPARSARVRAAWFPALPIKTLECPHELALCEKLSAFVPKAQDHPEPIYLPGRRTSNVHARQHTHEQFRRGQLLDPPLPPFAAVKFSFGNLALTMIGVWLGA